MVVLQTTACGFKKPVRALFVAARLLVPLEDISLQAIEWDIYEVPLDGI